MSYNNEFVQLCEQVNKSVEAGTFAKLTMAKTIGKLELKNIFIRPIYGDGDFKVLVKWSYRLREQSDVEKEMTLDKAFEVIESHLRNPFFSIIVFTTDKDIQMKINKKGVGSIVENYPTFQNVNDAVRD